MIQKHSALHALATPYYSKLTQILTSFDSWTSNLSLDISFSKKLGLKELQSLFFVACLYLNLMPLNELTTYSRYYQTMALCF